MKFPYSGNRHLARRVTTGPTRRLFERRPDLVPRVKTYLVKSQTAHPQDTCSHVIPREELKAQFKCITALTGLISFSSLMGMNTA